MPTKDGDPRIGEKAFCCNGCKAVYELLDAKDLCAYYAEGEQPGNIPKEAGAGLKYGFLDDENVKRRLIEFSDGANAKATFYVPGMHCSSCIYLLEHLYGLNPAITHSTVNFLKRQVSLTFHEQEISLREVVELLANIGYEPRISLEDLDEKESGAIDRKLKFQLGVAGFAFVNIMIFSLPEYFLTVGEQIDPVLRRVFDFIKLFLALPVFFYSGNVYFASAWAGLKQKIVNMDVPVALGIVALFARSAYEILSGTGAGYMDSLAGFVFFLLIGKFFQKKTYDALSFDRNYKSYFPVAVTKINDGIETTITVTSLEPKDRIMVRSGELIPADAILMKGEAAIDYSFVTGESDPVERGAGDLIYAGGRQIGGAIELEVVKKVSQSYLTRLWENDAFKKPDKNTITNFANRVAKYFTFAVLGIAVSAAIYWWGKDPGLAAMVFTSALIVACPCALALATPFTLGSVMRIFGRNSFYLKNNEVVERLAKITTIVFDKTGTLTKSGADDLEFYGKQLSGEELKWIKSVVKHSTHPLSVRIYRYLKDVETTQVEDYNEFPGKGINGRIDGHSVKAGSRLWVGGEADEKARSQVFISIDGEVKGYFAIKNAYRRGLDKQIRRLGAKFKLVLLSGDNDRERRNIEKIFTPKADIRFNQSPHDKLEAIEQLRARGEQVMMIGDGLNDAGALKAGDAGVAITEDMTNFSPASDALLDAERLNRLNDFLSLAKAGMKIIIASFILSFLYNVIGLGFALSGKLTPLVSAILMPLSSISVAVFTTLMTSWAGKRIGL